MLIAAAFFKPLGRPAVVVLSLVLLISVVLIIAVVHDEEFPYRSVDGTVLSILLIAGSAGLMSGIAIKDVQHCRFVWVLPDVQRQIRLGYGITALVVSGLIALYAGLDHGAGMLLPALTLSLGAFFLGCTLPDPLSRPRTLAHAALAVVLIVESDRLRALCESHPLWVSLAFTALAWAGLARATSTRVFRDKPLTPTVPIPGFFQQQQTERYEREKLRRRRSFPGSRTSRAQLRMRPLTPWGWTVRAFLDTLRQRPLYTLARDFHQLWPLLALLVLYASVPDREGSFGERMLVSVRDTVAGADILPDPGKDSGYGMLLLLLVGMSGVLFTHNIRTAPFDTHLLYPISRRTRLVAVFGSGLLETAHFVAFWLAVLVPVAIGTRMATGLAPIGDGLPFHVLIVLLAMIFIPFAHYLRIRGLQPMKRENRSSLMASMLLSIVSLMFMFTWCESAHSLFGSAAWELLAIAALFILSQAVYAAALHHHYTRHDL